MHGELATKVTPQPYHGIIAVRIGQTHWNQPTRPQANQSTSQPLNQDTLILTTASARGGVRPPNVTHTPSQTDRQTDRQTPSLSDEVRKHTADGSLNLNAGRYKRKLNRCRRRRGRGRHVPPHRHRRRQDPILPLSQHSESSHPTQTPPRAHRGPRRRWPPPRLHPTPSHSQTWGGPRTCPRALLDACRPRYTYVWLVISRAPSDAFQARSTVWTEVRTRSPACFPRLHAARSHSHRLSHTLTDAHILSLTRRLTDQKK